VDNPLECPQDPQCLASFLAHFGLQFDTEPLELLKEVATAYARLPYENLTKIIKAASSGPAEHARRTPHEVLNDHWKMGTGGTCFSLTATLLYLTRSLGWQAEPILADRSYGANTHCALLLWIDDRPHLIDPGYLIVEPIPLDTPVEKRVKTTFNEISLNPTSNGDQLDLHTIQQGRQTYRLSFKTAPVDTGEFLRAWDASFEWDMMRYPLLTRIAGDKQLYLQGSMFQSRSLAEVSRCRLQSEELIKSITADFGIDRSVTQQALSILQRRGEDYGQSPTG